MKKILIIQTAFIGDVILATPIVEKLSEFFPEAEIDFLVRKGNEKLLEEHPKINKVLIWKKSQKKYQSLFQVINLVRSRKYEVVIKDLWLRESLLLYLEQKLR